MSAREAIPSLERSDEWLAESDRVRVFRRHHGDGSSTIYKHPLGPDAQRRLRHEQAMLERLAGVPGVVQLQPGRLLPDMLALDDHGDTTLARALRAAAMPPLQVLQLARTLAGTVAAMHRRGVMHKDIGPGNIVLVGPSREPVLIDFNIANVVAEERPRFTHQSEIAGTLPYMAPEQTGRTGRPVDHRADLYALGATLYQALTGRPPFQAKDTLDLISDHLVTVPVPPVLRVPEVPQALSDIVMRLLEKEPDRRYQSAEGLATDLQRLAARLEGGDGEAFTLGEHDFAARLSPPSRLVGRDAELALLGRALGQAIDGNGHGVLVAGAPGVGKTALINELRPVVTARGGWFVSGKFDQCRRDSAASAVLQALRALGRMLLSEPEAELDALRPRLLERLKSNTELVAAVLPEFAMIFGIKADAEQVERAAQVGQAELRLYQASLELLRAVASPVRPVVMVVDDLQWAPAGSIGFFDALLTDDSLRGVLLVGAYREAEVDAAHPLSAAMQRWARLQSSPATLALRNLAQGDLAVLLGEMLRLPAERAAGLAEAVGQRTAGNPYDTVELVNALRRDGALVLGRQGWSWDARSIRQYVGQGEVVDLLTARIEALPPHGMRAMELMACLAAEIDVGVLLAGTGQDLAEIETALMPALEDGLLVLEQGGALGARSTVRFRHDRVQQAAYARLADDRRRELHLMFARRLVGRPAYESLAAEQYLCAIDALADPVEQRAVAALFDRVAGDAVVLNPSAAERFLTSAVRLLDAAGAGDDALYFAVQAKRAGALFYLRRDEELAGLHRTAERCRDPALVVQMLQPCMSNLSGRGKQLEALDLLADAVARLQLPGEASLLQEDSPEAWARFTDWVDRLDLDREWERAQITDPRVLALAALLSRGTSAASILGPKQYARMLYGSQRLWEEHGPSFEALTVFAGASLVSITLHGDYRTGYRLARFAMGYVSRRSDRQLSSSVVNSFAYSSQFWFEPLREVVANLRDARDHMLQLGAPFTASFAQGNVVTLGLDLGPTLETCELDIESGSALARRSGNGHAEQMFLSQRQLLRALRGQTSAPGSFSEDGYDEEAVTAQLPAHSMVASLHHTLRALSAAVYGDREALVRYGALAHLHTTGHCAYRMAQAQVLQCYALVWQARVAAAEERAQLLAKFEVSMQWLQARATDAPANFAHLAEWMEAERAWTLGDAWQALCRFERAIDRAAQGQRPWHHALMLERAARFHLEGRRQRLARALLDEAHALYDAWGAAGKVAELRREFDFLRAVPRRREGHDVTASTGVSADAVDMVAILRASQALSSETDLRRLKARVVEVLGALTGATQVLMMLRDDTLGWVLSPSSADAPPVPIDECAQHRLLPVSAFRYAVRTRSTLVVDDAVQDDRFAHDPYVESLQHCAMLVVPVLSHGEPRAVLMLENRLTRGAFAADRLDAVALIAGQLAVSLDNALLYASLERKVADRTRELESLNQRLAALSVTDALTGLANRRRFNEALHDEWQRAMRSQSPMGLAMIDVDQFKLYNDHYGHLGGDECLKLVARAIGSSMIRGADLAARFGGEEFVLLLPDTPAEGVLAVAERVRERVQAMALPHESSHHGVVTVSLGIVSFVPDASLSPEHWIEQADAALYAAKKGGRNRVVRVGRPSEGRASG